MNYDALADRAEHGDLVIKSGTVRRGSDAATEARKILMEATGVTNDEDIVRIALGRPRVGAKGGPSPVVRARVPQVLKDRVVAIAERENRKESDVVRDALAEYVEKSA